MKKLNTILVFILFVTLALVIGVNHEPWADEAQSWIIARDASCGEIIWDISRYEGTFPLWFLTIKLFISLGLQYEYFFIIPIIISSIGLLVFLKSVDCPNCTPYKDRLETGYIPCPECGGTFKQGNTYYRIAPGEEDTKKVYKYISDNAVSIDNISVEMDNG